MTPGNSVEDNVGRDPPHCHLLYEKTTSPKAARTDTVSCMIDAWQDLVPEDIPPPGDNASGYQGEQVTGRFMCTVGKTNLKKNSSKAHY